MPIDAAKRRTIEEIFSIFLRNRAQTIRQLRIENLQVNPFMISLISKQMGLSDGKAVVRWLMAQRLERGAVTSFGIALQNAAKVFSEGTGVEGADIMKSKHGHRNYIQVKSGPNTIPKDLGVRIATLLRSAQRRDPGSVALFGMCYGTSEQVSSIVKQYVQEEGGVDWISGRRFWEFISNDPNCAEEIYKIAEQVGGTFRDSSGKTLAEIIEIKAQELEREFEKLYGQGNKVWANLLRRNT